MLLPLAMAIGGQLLKKPQTYQASTKMPQIDLGKTSLTDSYNGDALGLKVAQNADKAQSAAEAFKRTASAEERASWIDAAIKDMKAVPQAESAPAKVDRSGEVTGSAMENEEAITAAANQVADENEDKADSARQLPSWISDTASVYSRLAQENAARDADLRAERRDSAANALNLLGQIPGIRDAWGRDAYRTRGLNVMAGN